MTDAILILNFLDKNYEVKTDRQNFIVFDKIDNKTMVPNDFQKHFLKIFSNFKIDDEQTSITIFYSWYNNKKRLLTKKLYDIFDTEDDTTLRSQQLLDKIIKFCDENYKYEYHHDFITNVFIDYYKDKYMIPKLLEYKNNFDANFGSAKLLNDFQDEFILEHFKIIEYAKSHLNNWYAETIIGDKISDLLSQLVITLGPRNWVVTWIGHGPFSKKRLLEKFINESQYHHDFILNMYDKWYEDAVIDASERAMMSHAWNNH